MLEFDDAAIGLGFRRPHRFHLSFDMNRVAMEHGMRERRLRHAEVGDRRAERGIVDRDADHQAEREQRIDQRLAPLALRREIEIDMQRLRVERHDREEHVVALGDAALQRVPEDLSRSEFLEIATGHLRLLRGPRV
jgi:hypothetical protein